MHVQKRLIKFFLLPGKLLVSWEGPFQLNESGGMPAKQFFNVSDDIYSCKRSEYFIQISISRRQKGMRSLLPECPWTFALFAAWKTCSCVVLSICLYLVYVCVGRRGTKRQPELTRAPTWLDCCDLSDDVWSSIQMQFPGIAGEARSLPSQAVRHAIGSCHHCTDHVLLTAQLLQLSRAGSRQEPEI
jgi:hypothetical protein